MNIHEGKGYAGHLLILSSYLPGEVVIKVCII